MAHTTSVRIDEIVPAGSPADLVHDLFDPISVTVAGEDQTSEALRIRAQHGDPTSDEDVASLATGLFSTTVEVLTVAAFRGRGVAPLRPP